MDPPLAANQGNNNMIRNNLFMLTVDAYAATPGDKEDGFCGTGWPGKAATNDIGDNFVVEIVDP